MKDRLLKNPEQIIQLLKECWSAETSSRYTPENPYRGQCSVTSLVIQDHFGGEIMKTRIDNVWHYYNKIGRQYYDFTAPQFHFEIRYDNILSNRKEAFEDANEKQYRILSEKFSKALKQVTSDID